MSAEFHEGVAKAIENPDLQKALAALAAFRGLRRVSVEALPEFSDLRQLGKMIRDHSIAHMAELLEEFEKNATANGSRVYWARDSKEANAHALSILEGVEGKRIVKGKSMVSEEIGLLHELEANGYDVVETDIGEYILQLAEEPPSHLVAPAMHKTIAEVDELFDKHHRSDRGGPNAPELVAEARRQLRRRYLEADIAITGANFLVAETGSIAVVTNEGNGDFGMALGKTHIVITSIEKVLPGLAELTMMLRLLGRAATGQEMTVYTTLCTGPRRDGAVEGPESMHIILVDNGRSSLVGGERQDLLRCIRCAGCLNHCPVYETIGGHAYGWVYPGPIGAALTPALRGLDDSCVDLPFASTLCGACQEACPVDIPLPAILKRWRDEAVEKGPKPALRIRWGLALWSFVARRPRLYRFLTNLASRFLGRLGRDRGGRFQSLPMLGGWTDTRDLPAPTGQSFQSMWRELRGESRDRS